MSMQQAEQDRVFLERAVELAHQNIRNVSGGPFGAVVVEEGRVLAEGANRVVPDCDPTAHAEVVALRKASALKGTPHLEGCTLYASCEPCPMCLASAYWAHIGRIVFAQSREDAEAMGFSDALIYEQVPLMPEKRSLRCERLDLPLARELIRAWKDSEGKRPY